MSIRCEDIRGELGAYIDGELPDSRRMRMKSHLGECIACRQELAQLETLVVRIGNGPTVSAPRELWTAIETRLNRAQAARTPTLTKPQTASPSWVARVARRPLTAAAVLLLALGIGWLVTNPWGAPAMAGQIDFRPLLEQANGDIGAGIQTLMRAYGGEAISASEASRRMTVRVAAPQELPHGLQLQGRYILNMGQSHRALAFHYTGPGSKHLLLLQCPPDIKKNYGGRECMACSIGDHRGHGVQVGKLHLMHMASSNVCICVVSTLSDSDLETALAAIAISF